GWLASPFLISAPIKAVQDSAFSPCKALHFHFAIHSHKLFKFKIDIKYALSNNIWKGHIQFRNMV
ncbi:hypothetical protein, partial [Salinicoccus sp. YB14-2]|uniref:hypothetical protein n=1 Tax=Salinicoccus sp. YB14-2 TaxID=1572701 RepID=UPI0006900C44